MDVTRDQLHRLLAEHEAAAAAIRATIGLLNGHANGGAPPLIDEALTRRRRRPRKATTGAPPPMDTAAKLALFDRRVPVSTADLRKVAGGGVQQIGLGVLVRHGYLKKKRGGYIRTAKPYPNT